MSKKNSRIPDRIEISRGWSNVKVLLLTTAVILIVPVVTQGQFPNGHQISGYITYGGSGFSGVVSVNALSNAAEDKFVRKFFEGESGFGSERFSRAGFF